MDRLIVRIVVLAIILIVITFWQWYGRRRAAKNIARTVDETFQPEHSFRKADPAEFPWLTHAFYDGAERDIAAAGFEKLADIEDETLTLAHPDKRTFVRVCIGPDGRMRAAIYEIVKDRNTHLQTKELLTELSDGGTIVTTSTPASRLLDRPAGLIREHVPESTPLSQMLPTHERVLNEYLQAHPGVTVDTVRTFEEATAAWQKGIDRQRKRIKAQGGIGREELQRLAPPGRAEEAGKVHDEMRKLN